MVNGATRASRRRRRVWLLVSLALVAAACSSSDPSDTAGGRRDSDVASVESTVPGEATTPTPGLDAALTPSSGGDAPGVGSGGAAPSNQGAPTGGSASGGGGSATPAPAGGSGGATPRPTGGELPVGLFYGKAIDSVPGLGVSNGDGLAMARAVVEWINANGGAGGRTIKLVTYGALITEDGTATDQAACAKFTQDSKVPVAVNAYSATATFFECMAQRGVPVFTAAGRTTESQAFHLRYRDFLYSVTPTTDREGATLADALARQGYFKDPGMKLGILHTDEARMAGAVAAFKEHAAAVGVKPTTVIASDGEQGSLQNAVVRFRSDGVTHVVLFALTNFPAAAAAQAYFPRYGVSSSSSPYIMAINTPAEALRRAVGAGWIPTFDVAEPQDPPLNEPTKRCRQIMRDAGQDSEARIVQYQLQSTCSVLFFLKAALDRAATADRAGIRDAVERIGSEWVPPLTFSAHLGSNRHDAADGYRNLVYDTGCACFRYGRDVIKMAALAGQR